MPVKEIGIRYDAMVRQPFESRELPLNTISSILYRSLWYSMTTTRIDYCDVCVGCRIRYKIKRATKQVNKRASYNLQDPPVRGAGYEPSTC